MSNLHSGNTFHLAVDNLFNGEKVLPNQRLTIEDGFISKIENSDESDDKLAGILVPGFIDIQVNGGGGVLFNNEPSLESITTIAKAHQKYGTTGWLPTLVTDSFSQMSLAAEAVARSLKEPSLGVLGVHFEGPYLSKEKKGVHSAKLIREINSDEMAILTRQDLGQVVVTLAPENVPAEQIKELVSRGVHICLGHSNATFEQANLALDAGATGFTHLFNAMSAMDSRAPGMVGAALLDQSSYAGIILDGIHVHPSSANLAYRNKKNLVLVTDAMPPVGCDETQFKFFGNDIIRDGLKLTDPQGRLAGSALDMLSAVRNAISMLDIDLNTAINLASLNPAKFLDIDQLYGRLEKKSKASMLLLDERNNIQASWVDGIKVV